VTFGFGRGEGTITMRVLADRGRGSNGVMMMMQGCTPVMIKNMKYTILK